MVASLLTILENSMTLTLRKMGLQQSDLTMTMIILCLFVDTGNSLCSYMFRIVNICVLG